MRKKLTLHRETLKRLSARYLTKPRGGQSGEPCDVTVGHSKCDLAGCSGGATCFVALLVLLLTLVGCVAPVSVGTDEQAVCVEDRDNCVGGHPLTLRDRTALEAQDSYPEASPTPLGINAQCSTDDAGHPFCSLYVSLPGHSVLFECTKYPTGVVCFAF